jgi:hypothetical protein
MHEYNKRCACRNASAYFTAVAPHMPLHPSNRVMSSAANLSGCIPSSPRRMTFT